MWCPEGLQYFLHQTGSSSVCKFTAYELQLDKHHSGVLVPEEDIVQCDYVYVSVGSVA